MSCAGPPTGIPLLRRTGIDSRLPDAARSVPRSARPAHREGIRDRPGPPRRPVGGTGSYGRGPWFVVGQYVALTKPRIIELLLITTIPVMFLAARGVPVAVAGPRDARRRDDVGRRRQHPQLLPRPRHRRGHAPHEQPAARHRHGVAARRRSSSASRSRSASTLWLGLLVNWLSAWLALGALLFYVGVYTALLKRRTAQNIVWGGAAGCMPVLVGWSAVTGSLAWAPFVLFAVVFFWTPPHYWPLSMKFKDDYAAAHVPMLPVVERFVVVARQVVAYSWAMVVASLLLVPVAPMGLALPRGGRRRRRALRRRGAPAAAGREGRRRRRRCCGRCGCSTSRSPT